jgi:hypothetical protein
MWVVGNKQQHAFNGQAQAPPMTKAWEGMLPDNCQILPDGIVAKGSLRVQLPECQAGLESAWQGIPTSPM